MPEPGFASASHCWARESAPPAELQAVQFLPARPEPQPAVEPQSLAARQLEPTRWAGPPPPALPESSAELPPPTAGGMSLQPKPVSQFSVPA